MARTKRTASVMGKKKTSVAKKSRYITPVTGGSMSQRTGLGTLKTVTMTYVEKFNLDPGALGALANYQFRLNSIFDPNLTGVGHQPTPHDQLEPLFENYTVLSAAYKVSIVNNDTNNSIIGGVYISDRENVSTAVDVTLEQGCVDWKHISVAGGGNDIARFQGKVDIPALMGYTRNQYLTSPQFETLFGSNPADQAFLTVFVGDSAGDDPDFVRVVVELLMEVRLQGTKLIPQS